MDNTTKPIYVDAFQIMKDWGVSKATAYSIIKDMNRQIKEENPHALIIAGKVSRVWYDRACMKQPRKGGNEP